MFRPIACIFSNSAVKLQVCFNKVELSSIDSIDKILSGQENVKSETFF